MSKERKHIFRGLFRLRTRLALTLSLGFCLLYACGLYFLWADRRNVLLLNLRLESEAVTHRVQNELQRAFRHVETRAALVADLVAKADGAVDLQLMGEGLEGIQSWSMFRLDGRAESCQRFGNEVQCRVERMLPRERVTSPQWKRADMASEPPTIEYWTSLPKPHNSVSELSFRLDLRSLLGQVPVSGQNGVYSFLVDHQGRCLCRVSENVLSRAQFAPVSDQPNEQRFALRVVQAFSPGRDPLTGQPGWMAVKPMSGVPLAVGVFFPSHLLTTELDQLQRTILSLGGALLLVLLGLVYRTSVRLSRPLETLTGAVLALSMGEFEANIGERSRILEVEYLRQAFSRMRSQLKESFRERELNSERRARILKELELASQIQTSNLPSTPIFVRTAGCVVVGRSLPAREVGGDFLDAFPLPDGRVAVFIGDVAGKGIPAALYTVLARNALKVALLSMVPPEQVLQSANALLCVDNSDHMFVTALVAVFQPGTGRVEFSRAGHCAPILWSAHSVMEMEGDSALPLGVMADYSYHRETLDIAEGEALLIYTDGISEAKNGRGELFGDERLKDSLIGQPGEAGCDQLVSAVDAFRDGTESNDDTTCLLLLRMA